MDPSTPPPPPSSSSQPRDQSSSRIAPGTATLEQPPAGLPQLVQMNRDADHLRLLSIFHYVLGGLVAFFGLFPLLHVAVGIAMLSAPLPTDPSVPHPATIGWLFIGIGSLIILIAEALAVMMLLNGRWISMRRNLKFCQVAAGIECIQIPLGTTLGIFTLLVLQRPSVRALFEENQQRWG